MAKLGKEARKRLGKAPKQKVVDALKSMIGDGSNGFFLANNKGLTVAQMTVLRAKARGVGVRVKVAKNTLLRIALEQGGMDAGPLKGLLSQETVVFSGADPVVPAKFLADLPKEFEKLQVKGGYVDGKVIDPAAVIAVSKLPGKPELIARLMGSMKAPAQNLVYALNQATGKVVFAVDAYRRKLEEGQNAA